MSARSESNSQLASVTSSGWYRAAQPFLAGCVAGVTATSIIQPLDFIKTQQQVRGEGMKGATASPASIVRSTLQTSGVGGFYAGISAALMRQVVYGSSRLGLFRVFSDRLRERGGGAPLPLAQKLGCGLFAGALAAVVGNPYDLALVRMQADSSLPASQRRNYRGATDALRRVVREEGVPALWRGSSPTVARAAFLTMAMMTTSEALKEALGPLFGGEQSLATLLLSSLAAGIAAAVASLPFDLIKTRLQKQVRLPDGTMPYAGLLDTARKVVAREGPLALYTGFPTYCLRVGPHAFITLVILERVNVWLGVGAAAAPASARGHDVPAPPKLLA